MIGPLLIGLYVFVLAIFIGFEVITKIPPTLHTPLMSGANAISGITLVGAIFAASGGRLETTTVGDPLGSSLSVRGHGTPLGGVALPREIRKLTRRWARSYY